MTEQLIVKIASAFKIAREEGVIHRFADGKADAEEVVEWVKEAGYKSPEEIVKFLASIAEDTLKKAREGYVKLAENQNLPRNPNLGIPAFFKEYKEAQEDLIKAGWRKVLINRGD